MTSIRDNKILDIVINVCKRSNDLDLLLAGAHLDCVRKVKIKQEDTTAFEEGKKAIEEPKC